MITEEHIFSYLPEKGIVVINEDWRDSYLKDKLCPDSSEVRLKFYLESD